MPNHLTHFLKIEGDINFSELYETKKENDTFCTPDFNKIIPQPPHIFTGNLSSDMSDKYGKHNCWYEWNITNWGTKWGSYDCVVHDEKLIEFQTAWSFPDKIFEALSMLHPEVKFTILWKDEGSDKLHKEVYEGGTRTISIIQEYAPEDEYDDDGELTGEEWSFEEYAMGKLDSKQKAA